MRPAWTYPLISLVIFLPACAVKDKTDKKKEDGSPAPSPLGMSDIQDFRRIRDSAQGGTPIKSGGNVGPVPIGGNLKPEEVVWTDPDDANAEIPKLDELMDEASKTKGPWAASEAAALRESKASGKPLLIWFTDSASVASDKPIAMELFNREEFEKWALENVVRLRVDQSPGGATMNETASRKIYVRKLKERYKVMGYPTLLLITPTGEVISRVKGYLKGQGDYKWGLLKQGVTVANENFSKAKAGLVAKGYRDWSDGKGRSIFARLTAYRDGDLILVEPDGQRARTNEKKLSADDREWIRKEKEKRGIQ